MQNAECTLEFCTGAGAVKSRGKPREYRGSGKNDHPSSRGSVGSGTDCCGNPAGPGVKGVLLPWERESPRFPSRSIVTAVRLIFTIIVVFIMLHTAFSSDIAKIRCYF